MRAIFIALAILAFAAPLWATDKYVDDDGAAAWGDCGAPAKSGASACSLGTANTNASAGDTVFMRAGTYTTAIMPTNAGTDADNRIVYIAYQSEDATISRTGTGVSITQTDWIKISGVSVIGTLAGGACCDSGPGDCYNISWFVQMSLSDYWWFENMYFENGSTWEGIHIANSDYGKLSGSTVIGGLDTGEAIELEAGSNHNVIEGNTIQDGYHSLLATKDSTHTVVRNNDFYNQYHNAISFSNGSTDTLFEDNTMYDSYGWNAANNCRGTQGDRDMQPYDRDSIEHKSTSGNTMFRGISRRNIIANSSHGPFGGSYSSLLKIYSNTMYANWRGYRNNLSFPVGPSDYKNNIATGSTGYNIDTYMSGGNEMNFTYNIVWGGDKGDKVFWQGAEYADIDAWETASSYASNNIQSDPSFTDAANRDFTLALGSPGIDAGDWLTTVVSGSGTSTQVQLADSAYFYDGWGITGETGDVIKTAAGQTATITNVDSGNSNITVSVAISWVQNEGIALTYNGSAPDIGYVEYSAAASSTNPPGTISFGGSGTISFGGDGVMQ